MNSREGVFTDRSSVERVILVLTMLGVCASIVALLSTINDIKNQFAPGQLYSTVIYKGTIYHVAHAAEMLFIGSAGLIAMFSTDFRAIERGYLMRLGLLFRYIMHKNEKRNEMYGGNHEHALSFTRTCKSLLDATDHRDCDLDRPVYCAAAANDIFLRCAEHQPGC